MSGYIEASKDNIVQILNHLEQIESEYHLPKGGIVAQVVQYKDYADEMTGELAEYITHNFGKLRNKLASFCPDGGASGLHCGYGLCEDIQGGLIRALEQMKQAPYNTYNHLILVVGDYPNHGDHPRCTLSHTKNGESIEKLWNKIYNDIRSLPSIRVMFMPVSDAVITKTMDRMQRALGPKIVDSAQVTTETNFVQVVTQTAITEYKRFVGIS